MRAGRSLLAAIAGACTAVEPPQARDLGIQPPPAWSVEAPAGTPPAEWWRSFGDADLERIVREALARNRALRAAAERVSVAAAQAKAAGADLVPSLSASFDGSRRKQVFVGFPIPGSPGPLKSFSTSYGVSLDLSWEVDLWGRLRAQRRAAGGEFAARAEDYRAARESLAAQVAKAWFALREAAAQEQLAAETLRNDELASAVARRRYEGGRGALVDLRLLEARTEEARAALQRAARARDAASRQLEVLLGRYPKGGLDAAAGLPPLPPPPPAGLPAELLLRRPDLRAAAFEVLADRYRARAARAALLPRIALTASSGTRSDALGDLLDGNFSVWNIAGNLLAPIFQGGRLRAGVAAADAATRERIERFADQALRAFAEVERALAGDEYLRRELAAQRRALERAEGAFALARERYEGGLSTVLEYLDAERTVFGARSRLLALERLALANRIDLHLALGGAFPSHVSADEPANLPERGTHRR